MSHDDSVAQNLKSPNPNRISDREVAAFWHKALTDLKRRTTLDESLPRTVLLNWRERVGKSSHKKAVQCLGGTLTFAELDAMSDSIAHYFLTRPFLSKGDCVAIMLPNLTQYVVTLLGILKAGMTVVNCNPLYTRPEIEHQLKDSGAKVLVTLANIAKTPAEATVPGLQEVIITEVADALPLPKRILINSIVRYVKKMVPPYQFDAGIKVTRFLDTCRPLTDEQIARVRDLEKLVNENDIAFIQYTGGTTGIAKGAQLSHRNICYNVQQSFGAFSPEWLERVQKIQDQPGSQNALSLLPLPFYHIYSLTCGFLSTTIGLGMTTTTLPNPREIKQLFKLMNEPNVMVVGMISTLMKLLLSRPEFDTVKLDPKTVIISGGMPTSPDVAAEWGKRTGTRITEGYGLTEASPLIAVADPLNPTSGVQGYPVAGTLIKLRDEEGRDLPLGKGSEVQGELLAKGPQVMVGYHKNKDETARIMSDDGYLMTGDVATIRADGLIEIVDRKKDMILVSGFNVYPNEIDAKAMATGLLLECATVGVPDAKTGERVVLYAVPAHKNLSQEKLSEALNESLTHYKRPSKIVFVDALPKNPVGKILRREVRKMESQK
ncbi:MAG TPA: AMP-binding protein [Oligoflexus sp.]|uniref:AMP-binding protein n=1 Tax=Oligoflexus sp. TaxID=1971216 RepID=UPI002D7FCD2E|nr:AMP-binding protein [Oligoflexus sp.]HET9240100.1 AMP-binding protein [Oligoflexus sp.]